MGAERRRTGLVLVISALLVAGVAFVSYAFDADLSGVKTSFGPEIDARLGSQVVHDFIADQDAMAQALSSGDQSKLQDRFTGNALQDVLQQMADTPSTTSPPQVSFRAQSLSVVRGQDPNDPSVLIAVREDGVKTTVTTPADGPPSEKVLSFHGEFWLRQVNGRYAVTDQSISYLPSSPLPAAGVAILALIAVAAAAVLVSRSRRRRPAAVFAPPAGSPALPGSTQPAAATPPAIGASPPEVVVRTFGGLHVIEGEQDWAQALEQRPVTGFVWQRLLVGTVRDSRYHPSREEIARQVSPRFNRDTQLKRMRNLVSQGLRELPTALKSRIAVEPQALSFRLEGCQVDAIELLQASALGARSGIEPAKLEWAQYAFEQSVGVFLPDFEKVEDLATDHHPTCTDLIKELRSLLTASRLELAAALADAYLQSEAPARAVAVLEPVLREHENRKDIADRLASAYRKAGRDAEAKALAARFA